MQFTQMVELQSFKADTFQNLPHNHLYSNYIQQIIPFDVKHTPEQYYTILHEVQSINQSRSMTQSLMEQMRQSNSEIVDPKFHSGQFNKEKLEDIDQEQDQQQSKTVVSIPRQKRSTIFIMQNKTGKQSKLDKKQHIKIYYFCQPIHKSILYLHTDTVDTLIKRSLSAYKQDQTLDQTLLLTNNPKSKSPYNTEYDLRVLQKQGSQLPNITIDPIPHEKIVTQCFFKQLVLVHNKDKSQKVDKKDIKSYQINDELQLQKKGQIKLNIFNQDNIQVTSVILNKDDTLKKGIDYLQIQLKQKIVLKQNLSDQYPFPQDFDIKNLLTTNLYIKKKKYTDQPQQLLPIKSISNIPKNLTKKQLPPIGINQASRYQQFKVIKINNRGVKQNRILGIDQSKIYNYDPAVYNSNKQPKFLSFLVGNNSITGTKTPQRLISDIIFVNSLLGLQFQVYFIQKKITYVAQSKQQKQKIVRKIKFLVEFSQITHNK